MKRFVFLIIIVIIFAIGAGALYFLLVPEKDNSVWESESPYMTFNASDYHGEIILNNGIVEQYSMERDGDFFYMYGLDENGKKDNSNLLMSGYIRFFGDKLQILSDDGNYCCTLYRIESPSAVE